MAHFLNLAKAILPAIQSSVRWGDERGPSTHGSILRRLPLVMSAGQPVIVSEPLLAHSMALRPEGGASRWGRCLPFLPCQRAIEDSSLTTQRIVNAREVWPGLIMSATPGNRPGLLRDWLAALAEQRVGLVIDLRTDQERAADGWGHYLGVRRIDADGTLVDMNVLPGASHDGPQRWSVSVDLEDAELRRRQHDFEVIQLPLEPGEAPSTAMLGWIARVALDILQAPRLASESGSEPAHTPSVLVQSPQGLDRAAPMLTAIRLLQCLEDETSAASDGSQLCALVRELAVDLRARRGPAMNWSAPMLAPVLALAQASRRKPSQPPVSAKVSTTKPWRWTGKSPAQKVADELLLKRRTVAALSGRPITRPGKSDPWPGEGADAAPPPPADPPSQKA